jgi:hypothetical protein
LPKSQHLSNQLLSQQLLNQKWQKAETIRSANQLLPSLQLNQRQQNQHQQTTCLVNLRKNQQPNQHLQTMICSALKSLPTKLHRPNQWPMNQLLPTTSLVLNLPLSQLPQQTSLLWTTCSMATRNLMQLQKLQPKNLT